MTFALILTLFGVDSTMQYAVYTDMNAIDCAIALAQQESILLQTFAIDDFSLHCNGSVAHED